MQGMPHRIEVAFKENLRDAFGKKTAARIKNDLGLAVESVRTIDCYTIDATFTMPQLELVARDAYGDPIPNADHHADAGSVATT